MIFLAFEEALWSLADSLQGLHTCYGYPIIENKEVWILGRWMSNLEREVEVYHWEEVYSLCFSREWWTNEIKLKAEEVCDLQAMFQLKTKENVLEGVELSKK
jgi:hypothetical protein